jgi:hypothetical protein
MRSDWHSLRLSKVCLAEKTNFIGLRAHVKFQYFEPASDHGREPNP